MLRITKKKPKIKKLEDLELLDINLIADTPIEYAYLMPNSNRVIQKADKSELLKLIEENVFAVEYVKMGPNCDFELTASIDEFEPLFKKAKRKNAKYRRIQYVLLFLPIMTTHFLMNYLKEEKQSRYTTLLEVLMICIFLGALAYYIFKDREKKNG